MFDMTCATMILARKLNVKSSPLTHSPPNFSGDGCDGLYPLKCLKMKFANDTTNFNKQENYLYFLFLEEKV